MENHEFVGSDERLWECKICGELNPHEIHNMAIEEEVELNTEDLNLDHHDIGADPITEKDELIQYDVQVNIPKKVMYWFVGIIIAFVMAFITMIGLTILLLS